jgi:bifunctional non-homologous end joining protein LigD
VLCTEISHSIRAWSAVLDGEIVCLDADGRSNFYRLMFRRDWPYFHAFYVLSIDGQDLRDRPLAARKRHLRRIMPWIDTRLLYVDDVPARGVDLFRLACDRDLEGIVGKWRDGRYETDGVSTSWVKIKNPAYSQMVGRRDVFEARRDRRQSRRRDWSAPILRLHHHSLSRAESRGSRSAQRTAARRAAATERLRRGIQPFSPFPAGGAERFQSGLQFVISRRRDCVFPSRDRSRHQTACC